MRVLIIILLILSQHLSGQPPYLCFTDLVSGPATGNSDDSQPGQVAGRDGAIVTVRGQHLGDQQEASQVLVNGLAAHVTGLHHTPSRAAVYFYIRVIRVYSI